MPYMIRTGTALPARTGTADAAAVEDHAFIELSAFNLFWIFIIGSIVGLLGETFVTAFIDGRVESRAGLVWGPFSPLYGLGGLFFTLMLNDFKKRNPLALICASALVGGALEFCAGWFWEHCFGIVAWSYANRPFTIINFGNYTCLRMMIIWGLAGYVWMHVGLPVCMRIIGLIPENSRRTVTIIMASFLAVDVAMTFVTMNCWFERLAGAPIENPIQMFCAAHYGNDWMASRFQTMTMTTSLASLR